MVVLNSGMSRGECIHDKNTKKQNKTKTQQTNKERDSIGLRYPLKTILSAIDKGHKHNGT